MIQSSIEVELNEWKERYGAEVDVARLLCDEHAEAGAGALLYEGQTGTREMSYAELGDASSRLAGALAELGVGKGDRVAVMLPKSPELLISLVAIWRLGAVQVPLFTAFGPDAAAYRATHSGASVVITDLADRPKFESLEGGVTAFICVSGPDGEAPEGDLDFAGAVESGTAPAPLKVSGDDLMILLYTSGTTGQPKGVEFPVSGLASVHAYMRHGLDLRPDDVFWNIADPGWGYGLWFGVVGAMLLGRRMILRGLPFDPEAVLEAIIRNGVTNLAAAPTAYRSMRAAGVPAGFPSRSRLRVASSAGEPLNPELLDWSERELGVALHDHYGQSETGMTVAFHHDPRIHRDPLPGATGFSAPGFRMTVLAPDGREAEPGVEGEMALDIPASPLYWFRGYYRDPERTAERFRLGERYFLTADAASIDETGILRFASRADDVISSAGYRIGPFEVENALIAHPAVVEVAVIGTPDELRGEAVTAFVVTTAETEDGEELGEELRQMVKSQLAKHLYPRHVIFVAELPRTPSGKIRRKELRDQWQAPTSPA